MDIFKSKIPRIPGTDFHEVYGEAFSFYKKIKAGSRRRPYVRSAYFKKDKIFLKLFWHHLREKKNFRDKIRRLKYFPCAIELIKESKLQPTLKQNPNKKSEILYRFAGINQDNQLFFVQIKESKKTKNKWLISVFPDKK